MGALLSLPLLALPSMGTVCLPLQFLIYLHKPNKFGS